VVTSGVQGSYLGLLNVQFDEQGRAIKWSGAPLHLDDQTLSRLKAPPIDHQLSDKLKELTKAIHELMAEKIGEIVAKEGETVLESDSSECRRKECRSGDAITSAFLDFSPSSQVALINSGAVRSSLPAGLVSMGDVLTSFPFQNYIYKAKITGEELWKILEISIEEQKRSTGGGFLQVAGLRVTYKGMPNDYRLKEVLIQSRSKWVPLNPKATYELITIDYLVKGGDSYDIFKNLKWDQTGQLIEDIFIDFLKKGPINVNYEPRIIFESE
jgi:5'-nucleotidase